MYTIPFHPSLSKQYEASVLFYKWLPEQDQPWQTALYIHGQAFHALHLKGLSSEIARQVENKKISRSVSEQTK
jgi:hypothetical protein